ncbi:amino acid/amide ABC transporter substrate-binding protein (HAAT family) [Sphaerotilus hippei]|uniref:Amino acid/amide ABC transporter substrate-binding protein (HAAT family) n=1 Tax=Sphaerotilus hippei TaxID=744406 RepID=A0A318H264_9BURK|nr:branched-chain amino acid ABC transporter substrate-binding protein [Sphaerotilus hippei]PXW95540.1 amino acid/amide ABC transporter substrate-binding protein (HAAT family) [Sphaerotilus hippei]
MTSPSELLPLRPASPSRRTALAWASAACLGGLVGPLSAAPAAAPAGEPIRLALIEGLSGPFANAGEAVARNLQWAVERVNARGGVKLPGGARPLALVRMDSKGSTEEALGLLRSAADQRISVVMQGNSSATAAALIDALGKHNQREPERRIVFLNYSAVEPSLTNEKCSPWHFRFDAHADMRLNALTDVLQGDRSIQRVYLIGQDYSFGQQVLRSSREMLAAKRPDLKIVGEELHPIGRVKDFLPYANKIKASGAQAVITGNWGNDLTFLVKAARDVGFEGKFYTFYGNALGVPGALGDAGVGRVLAVAEWHPNAGNRASEALVAAFHQRFPDPREDYLHVRMQVMVEMAAQAMERSRSTEAAAVARALSGASYDGRGLGGLGAGTMRAADHQFQQPMYVSLMQRAGSEGVKFDVEGSGYGFRTVRYLEAQQAAMPHRCSMPPLP